MLGGGGGGGKGGGGGISMGSSDYRDTILARRPKRGEGDGVMIAAKIAWSKSQNPDCLRLRRGGGRNQRRLNRQLSQPPDPVIPANAGIRLTAAAG